MCCGRCSAPGSPRTRTPWWEPSTSSPPRGRLAQRNGYRHRPLDTRAGTIDLAIPELRQGSYFPDWLTERRKRAEKHSRETCRRPPKPADAGGSGAAPFQNFPYVFVLFHNYDLFFMPYGPRLPCFRFCGLYFRGAEYKQDFRTKKSAATYILRLIYLSEPEGPRSWLFSDPLP